MKLVYLFAGVIASVAAIRVHSRSAAALNSAVREDEADEKA